MHPEHPRLVLFPLHDDPRYALAVGALVRETVSVPQILCPALVGRGAELEAPVRMLDAGCGGAVVVLGEAGIGKSRLVRELTGHARARRLVVVSGRAVQSRQPTPYRPLAEAVMGACRRLRLPADPELIPYRPALGRLLPEWSRPERDAAPVSAVTLGEGVLRLVKALAGEGGRCWSSRTCTGRIWRRWACSSM
jgi:hypothetical protein